MSRGIVAWDSRCIKKQIWSITLSQKSYKLNKQSCATTTTTSTTEPTTEPTTSTTTTHHRTHHLHHTSTVPPLPHPALNHNYFLNPLNDNSSTSFFNPLIVGGDIRVTIAETIVDSENEPRTRTSRGRERAEPATEVMVIDKSWTSLEKHEKAFYTVLKKFVDDCKPLVDSVGNIRCPCKSCRLVLWVSIKHLSDHILKYGFDPSYKTWIHHGEADLPPPPPIIDNTRQPQMSDMTTCLYDLSYIPLNNEQNEPTQGDIGYKLPPSYYAIKKTFIRIRLAYESIHVCVNDCFLFCGVANKDVNFSLVCNTSRWKDSKTPGKKFPKKVLCYFSIIPRLQHLYKSSHTAKEMTWHATGKCTKPEPRNVRLGLAADAFNPSGNPSQSYNMWPMILTTYNLPMPLIDDLKALWAKPSVETIYVATGQKFNMRAMVLWTINDFPARSSLSRWSGQGYKTCPTCNEDTPYVHVLGKTSYVGHRRFLKNPHKWRRSLEFIGEKEDEDPPKEFDRD
nr:hypothetical protein [Tanacetum cinerariifolium]